MRRLSEESQTNQPEIQIWKQISLEADHLKKPKAEVQNLHNPSLEAASLEADLILEAVLVWKQIHPNQVQPNLWDIFHNPNLLLFPTVLFLLKKETSEVSSLNISRNSELSSLKSSSKPTAAAHNYSTQLLPYQESSAQQLRQNPPPVAAPYQYPCLLLLLTNTPACCCYQIIVPSSCVKITLLPTAHKYPIPRPVVQPLLPPGTLSTASP